MFFRTTLSGLVVAALAPWVLAQPPQPELTPLFRLVDLDIGQPQQVRLSNGKEVTVKLLSIRERSDSVRDAIRQAVVQVEIDGQRTTLAAGNYELPRTVGQVQLDCLITKGYLKNAGEDYWGLANDARLRLWPAGSPYLRPGTFGYPIRQRWFASATQMANEPCYVNACEDPKVRKIYYHYGLDFGGCEGLAEVAAAADGLIVSVGKEKLAGYEDTPVKTRYDVVYVLDARGWYYRYSHLFSINESLRLGERIRRGQPIGLLGKEGGSGGWTHLHFDIHCRMPSGLWGCLDSYAFAWEAYQNEYRPQLIAVARPHHTIWPGETIVLDAGRSWSAKSPITDYRWTFSDGTTVRGRRVERTYPRPGYYNEILQVTDAEGRVEYDFAIVYVLDREHSDSVTPAIHVAYYPTLGIQPGQEVTFKARTFATTDGVEQWDFGDGSAGVETQSDGNVKKLAKDGYAIATHAYDKPGKYLVSVRRTDRLGRTAVDRVCVRVGEP